MTCVCKSFFLKPNNVFKPVPYFNKEVFDSVKEAIRKQTLQKFNSVSVICEKKI